MPIFLRFLHGTIGQPISNDSNSNLNVNSNSLPKAWREGERETPAQLEENSNLLENPDRENYYRGRIERHNRLKNASKRRLRSFATASAAAEGSGKETSIDEPKIRKIASEASDGSCRAVEDTPLVFEKMTLQQMQSSLGSSGARGEGCKHEHVVMSKTDAEDSLPQQNLASLEEKPAVAKRNHKRKAVPEDEPVESTTTTKDSEVSGGRSSKRQVKQSPKDSVDIRMAGRLIFAGKQLEDGRTPITITRTR